MFSHITHHMGRVADTNQYEVTRITPIIRLGVAGSSCYLQGGHCYDEGGKPMDLPGWAYGEMAKLTPAALKEAGYDSVPTPPSDVKIILDSAVAAGLWQCPDCGKLVDPTDKENHIAKHNRKLDAASQIPNRPVMHAKH